MDTVVQLLQAYEVHVAGSSYWHNFAPAYIPVTIFDGQHTYLWNHPAPPADFEPYADKLWRMEGRYRAIIANTATQIGDSLSAIAFIPDIDTTNQLEYISLLVHEAFHVYQRSYGTLSYADENILFLYPDSDVTLLQLRRLENYCLAQLHAQEDMTEKLAWARSALDYRQERFTLLADDFVAYERANEVIEGTALYVDHQATTKNLAFPVSFALEETRARGYYVGALWCTLLDALAVPQWQAKLFSQDRKLDSWLHEIIPQGQGKKLAADIIKAIRHQAQQDIDALQRQRSEARATFAKHQGWRVQIETTPERLLQLTGFDPMNILKLDDTQVLHQRYGQFTHEESSITVMDAVALSYAYGEHPVMSGMRKLEINLEHEPSFKLAGDGVNDVIAVLHLASEQLNGVLHQVQLLQEEKCYTLRLL